MRRTYTVRHEIYIKVEADSRDEAAQRALRVAEFVRNALPVGATLSTSRVVQR